MEFIIFKDNCKILKKLLQIHILSQYQHLYVYPEAILRHLYPGCSDCQSVEVRNCDWEELYMRVSHA